MTDQAAGRAQDVWAKRGPRAGPASALRPPPSSAAERDEEEPAAAPAARAPRVERSRRWLKAAGFLVALAGHVALVAVAVRPAATEAVTPPAPVVLLLDLTPSPPARPARRIATPAEARRPRTDVATATSPLKAPSAPQPGAAVLRASTGPEGAARLAAVAEAQPAASPARAPTAAAQASAAQATASPWNAKPASTWQGTVLARLERFKRYPLLARTAHQEGVVYLRFTVDRQGRVLSARIDRSSNCVLLDDEAMALVRRAEPLPEPPPEIPGDPVALVVPIDFTLAR